MRAIKWCRTLSLVLAIIGTPALADITATYERRDSGVETLIFEIAEDGTVRVSDGGRGDESYVLFTRDQRYQVSAGPGGPVVETVEAVGEMRRRSSAESITFGGSADEDGDAIAFVYAPIGPAQIAGYDGVRYDFPGSHFPERSQTTLSDDIALRPLGPAFDAYNRATDVMGAFDDEETGNFRQLVLEHGVLAIWGYELKAVTFEKIDKSRFAIPAKPLTLADLPVAEPPDAQSEATDANADRPYVVSADMHDKILYTLLSDGRLEAWSEGAT